MYVCMYVCNLVFLFFDSDASVEQESNRNCQESEEPAGSAFSQNPRLYIVLKLPNDPYTMLVFH